MIRCVFGRAISTSAVYYRDVVVVNSVYEFDQVLRPVFKDANLQPAYGHLMSQSDVELVQGQSKTFDCSATARTLDQKKTMFTLSYR